MWAFVACGIAATGYTAAINQLSFGAAPGDGAGDACGRCFRLTGSADPYSPSYTGPWVPPAIGCITSQTALSGRLTRESRL